MSFAAVALSLPAAAGRDDGNFGNALAARYEAIGNAEKRAQTVEKGTRGGLRIRSIAT